MGFNKNTWSQDLSHKPGLKRLAQMDAQKRKESKAEKPQSQTRKASK